MLPASFATVTVFDTLYEWDGDLAQGTVKFIPTTDIVRNDVDDYSVLRDTICATLVNGAFSISVPVTNDPDIAPSGWAYQVIIKTRTVTKTFKCFLPSGPALRLTEQAPVTLPPSMGAFVRSVNHVTPDITGDVTISIPHTLDQLNDVIIASPSTDQVLAFNGINWVNAPASGGSGGETPSLPLFNVEEYGAVGDGTTDDYTAIRAAWDAMLLSPVGGLLYFPRAVTYRAVATGHVTATLDKAYAMFPLPMLDTEVVTKKVFGILGVGDPYSVRSATTFGAGNTALQVQTASVLHVDYSTAFTWHATNGHPSVFAAPDADKTGHAEDNIVTSIHLFVDGIIIRQPDNPSLASINAELCSTMHIKSLRCDVVPVLDRISETTHPTGVAVLAPKSNNNVAVLIDRIVCEGMYAGVPYTEHLDLRSAIVLACKIGFHNRRACSHFGTAHMMKMEQNTYGLAGYDPEGVGPNLGVIPWRGGTVIIDFYDAEDFAYLAAVGNPIGKPWLYTPTAGSHIYAPNGGLTGQIRFRRVNSEPLPPTGIGENPTGVNDDIYVNGNTDGGLGLSGCAIYAYDGSGIPIGARRHLGHVPSNPATAPPNVPTIGVATAGSAQGSFTFTPPVGGQPVVDYELTVFLASNNTVVTTQVGSTSPIVVTGLSAVAVYGKVKARNAAGNSAFSAASNTITPSAPVVLPEDTFVGQTGALVGSVSTTGSKTWQGDAAGRFARSGTNVVAVFDDPSWGAAFVDTGINDMRVSVNIVYGALESGVTARVTDETHSLYMDLEYNNTTTFKLHIYQRTAGGFTSLSDEYIHTTAVLGQTYKISLQAQGSTLHGYLDDVLVINATDTSGETGQGAGVGRLNGPFDTTLTNFKVEAAS